MNGREGDVRRTAALREAGYTRGELHRMRRCRELTVVRRGVYVAGRPPDDAAARHLLQVQAAVAELDASTVVSHISAAVVHGLSVWGQPLGRVQVTRNRRRTGARCGSLVHVHSAPLSVDEIVVVDGVACTSVARTVADLARVTPFEQAVVSADAALRRGLDRAELDEAVRRAKGWVGVPAARRAVAFADGRSESVGESRSRVAIMRAGLPAPVLQWPVHHGGTTFYADFGWPAHRTVGEFDGKVKYGRLLRPGQDAGDVVFEEKLREDAIRAEVWEVARWTWVDLDAFSPTAKRIWERFAAADRRAR